MNTASSSRPTAGTSKRYKHFKSALQLATQKSSNKWTYSDFQACFPLYCADSPHDSQSIMSLLARELQALIEQGCEEYLGAYDAPEAIDRLHECVVEGKENKSAGLLPKDAWKDELEPRAAVRARTIPLLEKERDRMQALLQEYEAEAESLVAELEKAKAERDTGDEKSMKLLDSLDATVASFAELNQEDIVNWGLTSLESTGSDIR